MRLTPAVKKLCKIMIIVFLLQMILPLQCFALFNGEDFRPYQLITHMFMHGNLTHIFSNMLIFVVFSPTVEEYLGSKKFIWLFILSGIVGAICQMLAFTNDSAMIGASAAIYGTTLAYILVKPKDTRYFSLLPLYIIGKCFVVFLFMLEILSIFSGTEDHIGHIAHIFGGLTGLIFLFFNQKSKIK